MIDFKSFFQKAIEENASDLHLIGGNRPILRMNGSLVRINEKIIDTRGLEEFVFSVISSKQAEKLKNTKELDLSLVVNDRNFRLNIHYQKKKIGLAARLIPARPLKPEEIGLDEVIYNLTHLNDGLVLVTGATGTGKSTTLATMINIINQERMSHIITIEDPIEFYFKEEQSLIEQREIGIDTKDFASALRHSLRQDPNVIMVGEMRDVETISAALTAAETGHLVLSTLHTSNAVETISRIVNAFPRNNRTGILNQLSNVLRAVISQQLLPAKDGKMVAAREIMVNTAAISNLIRSDKFSQIYSILETSHKDGMITMNKAVENLENADIISSDTANKKKRNLNTKSTYY